MSEEIKNLQEDEDEILRRIELSPLKNFVFIDYTTKTNGTQE